MINYKRTFYLSVILFCLSFVFSTAQSKISQNDINSLIKKGDSLSDVVFFSESLPIYKKANLLANKIGYEDGIIRSDFKLREH